MLRQVARSSGVGVMALVWDHHPFLLAMQGHTPLDVAVAFDQPAAAAVLLAHRSAGRRA